MFKNNKPLTKMTLEEKVDQILETQRSMRRWAIVKTLTNVVFLFLFIILPLVGMVYFFDWAKNSAGLDIDQMQQIWENLKAVGESNQVMEEKANQLMELLNR